MECEVLASDAVTLERATPDMSPLLENLLELYIHDLSEIFAVELGPDGRFGYDKLPLYWTDPVGRHIFLIKYGGRVAGFAMATRGSPASQSPTDLDVAEIFVLRARRGNERNRRRLLERRRPFLHVRRVRREHLGGSSGCLARLHVRE
jgi:predicted acetyltransferase